MHEYRAVLDVEGFQAWIAVRAKDLPSAHKAINSILSAIAEYYDDYDLDTHIPIEDIERV